MALSNSQYDQLMRDYEQLQLDNEHKLRLSFDVSYAKIQSFAQLMTRFLL